MPLLSPERFVALGIDPPKGVLLWGPPGTGKTLTARAVANRTDACFICVIGSELVQRYDLSAGEFFLVIFDKNINIVFVLTTGLQNRGDLESRDEKILRRSSGPIPVLHINIYHIKESTSKKIVLSPPLRYVGEGARMVRELFALAKSKKAAILFIDEIDAIGGARGDEGGDNEVSRTMLEIVNQLDGFESRGNVKVLMATNRPDTLDAALLRYLSIM